MNVQPLELDLFLCAFILGNFAWSLWGKGEGCVRSWNWPRKGWLKVVVLNSGAKKIPSWTFWKGGWWLAAEVLTFSRGTFGRLYMLAEGSWWWLLSWVNSYFKARYTQYLKYFPFILKMTFLSPAASLSSPCPRALSLSIYWARWGRGWLTVTGLCPPGAHPDT